MTEFAVLGLFFIGIAVGSLTPTRWMWVPAMAIGLVFYLLDVIFELKFKVRK